MMAADRKKAGPAKGERPDPYAGNEPTLDPALEEIREQEAKKLAEVTIDRTVAEPSIDPELVKLRDAEAKRGTKVIGGSADTPVATIAEPKAPAKKAAAKKSSK